MKNEKIVLITSHLQEARGQKLATMKVPGQHLLQANESTSDNNDKKGGHDTVVLGETWCRETEGMLNESENDDGECELLPSPAKKKCSTRSGHALHSIGESLNPKWYRKVLRPK